MKPNLELKIEFLGTGTSQGVPVVACACPVCRSSNPKDNRLRSALFIDANGSKIVIDAGPDFRQQMLRIGLCKLDAIFLTHEHTDHIFGLDDIRAFNWVQKHPTDIYAEKRVQSSIKRVFDYVFETNKYPGIPQMNLHLVENKPFKLNEIEVIPVRGFHHRLPVFGFRLGQMAYLTDVNRVEPEEQEKLRNLDILIVNALRFEKHISHFNLEEAIQLIQQVKPKQAYLTHISHLMGKHEDVQRQLPDNISLAHDGLKLEL
ncbi:MBL fold metallo-hydrolase [Sunxiuqinia sp. sy24]|uniref:MBL fold metallo-hydrolase n=1 Tax=Sunxiuqinia sp. sy24 TaxID=3461495 RepID=UPI00404529A4